MNIKKLKAHLSLICVLLVLTVGFVYAGSGSYNSTYDMTGGVYSRTMSVGSNPSFTCNLYPAQGVYDAIIRVFLEYKEWYGYTSVASNDVSSTSSSSSNFTKSDSGTYRFYLRNYTGLQMTGDCSFSWQW